MLCSREREQASETAPAIETETETEGVPGQMTIKGRMQVRRAADLFPRLRMDPLPGRGSPVAELGGSREQRPAQAAEV